MVLLFLGSDICIFSFLITSSLHKVKASTAAHGM